MPLLSLRLHDAAIGLSEFCQRANSSEGIVTLDGVVCSKTEEQAVVQDAALTANVIHIVDNLKAHAC